MGYLRLLKVHSRLLIFGLLLANVSCFGQTFFISLFSGQIRSEFNLSHGEFGLLYAGFILLSGAALVWLGGNIDRVKLKAFTFVAFIGFILSAVLLSQAHSLGVLFFSLVGIRFAGQGLLSHIALTTMARYLHESRGKALSIVSVGFSLAEAFLPISLVYISRFFDWREIWLGIAMLISFFIFPFVMWLLKVDPSTAGSPYYQRKEVEIQSLDQNSALQIGFSTKKNHYNWTRAQVLKNKNFYCIMPAFLAPTLILTGIFFNHVPLALEKGWQMDFIAVCFCIFAIANFLGGILFGHKVDKYGALSLLPNGLPILWVGLFSLAFIDAKVAGLIYMFCAGMSVGANRIMINVIWPEMYGERYMGEIRVMVTALCVVCSAVSPVIIGFLLDHGMSLREILVLSCLYIMFSLLLLKQVKFNKSIKLIEAEPLPDRNG
jgi:MFS family permease